MPVGIVHDLAVGVDPGGADAWALQDVLAGAATVGAPPDTFNQLGQDWQLPPWHPRRLAEAGYAPYRDLLRAVLRHGGGVRIDHILGLFRLWWIPENSSAADGSYVRYDEEALLGVLALEAHRAGAIVVGEDLGTVERRVQRVLVDRGVLGSAVAGSSATSIRRPAPTVAVLRLPTGGNSPWPASARTICRRRPASSSGSTSGSGTSWAS